jgi:hypothetical protein
MTETVTADESDGLLAAICAVWDRPYTEARRTALRAAFVGKLPPAALARLLEWASGEQAPERMPTISQLWSAYHGLRERARPRPAAAVVPELDPWVRSANWHMLAVCLRSVARRTKISPEETAIIVRYKNAWAEDMREANEGGDVPVEVQQAAWKDCMARAWADIERLRGVAA